MKGVVERFPSQPGPWQSTPTAGHGEARGPVGSVQSDPCCTHTSHTTHTNVPYKLTNSKVRINFLKTHDILTSDF